MAKSKVKTAYFCQSCGSQHPKWQGQCSVCKEWNTLVEEVVQNPYCSRRGCTKRGC